MSVKTRVSNFTYFSLLSLLLTGCFHPPYNDFKQNPPRIKNSLLGSAALGIASTLAGVPGVGFGVGATAGAMMSIHNETPKALATKLESYDIQFIQYGDTRVLIIPTDIYYEENSTKINELRFEGLNTVVDLLKLYPCSQFYVAAFSDNIGSKFHKKMLTQGQAESMLTYLWANKIKANLLKAEGFSDKYPVGDNALIRGSALNRRVEIQWIDSANHKPRSESPNADMK